ncbi:MAG TPA: AbrB/MazE/SpoVT family DNA-binding domain-containing protein [Candidatus Dormibacteraeota bacterium]|nr:AbrB/MazE/SpoVT family DNA-binding domain-containing protein [Candidatus Dormibacteraeota bacterium]
MSRFVGVRGRGEIVLPADVRRRHQLDQPGAQVEVVEREDGVIELRPQVSVPADQAWFWTRSWQEGERRVDEHVAAGEVEVSADADQFLRDIDAARRKPRSQRRTPRRR